MTATHIRAIDDDNVVIPSHAIVVTQLTKLCSSYSRTLSRPEDPAVLLIVSAIPFHVGIQRERHTERHRVTERSSVQLARNCDQ
jgi:hypothetical protein